jgi:tetratricopeptide (TPR) repeat protein
VRYVAEPTTVRYLFTLGAFILCLMSKPMGVTLPFVLLLLDYWPLKRFTIYDLPVLRSDTAEGGRFTIFRLVREKIPFLILSFIGCALTLRAQELAIVSTAGLTVSQRFVHVLAAYNHYLVAMFVPRNLAVYYPYQIHLPAMTITCAVIVLGLTTLLAIKNIRRRPYIIVGWLWYLGTLVPVIGLVQVGDQAWADRYTYLPLIGLFVPVVWFAFGIIKSRLLLKIASLIVSVALLAATAAQLGNWKNTRTLFEHAAKVTPNNYMAITMLGSLLAKEHKYDEAMADYRTALRYEPNYPEAHFFMGNALDEQGKLDEAIAEYQKALWFKPTQEQTHIFMAIALAKQKKYDAAMAHYEAALKLNPDSAVAQHNLARLLHSLGRLDDAIQHYHAALEIDPKLALAHSNLGVLLIQKGNLAEGTKHLREALKLEPGNAETEFNLASALNQQEQWSEAAGLFTETMTHHLNDPNAHYEFAVALAHLKRTREAMSQYAAALLIQPDFPNALDGLAWTLSADPNPDFRNGTEAVRMSERACELTGRQDPMKLKTLAAAYAETGRFEEAISTLRTAKGLAAKANRQELVKDCSLMLEHFQRAEPWRGP